jgi:hypothetical protein
VLMTCRTAVNLIPDYLSTRINVSGAMAFHSHIDDCTDCAAILRTYRKTIELTRTFLHRPSRTSAARNPAFFRRRIHSTHPLIIK